MPNAQVLISEGFSHFHSNAMVNEEFPAPRPYGFESVHPDIMP
jgi:hypothetical protein